MFANICRDLPDSGTFKRFWQTNLSLRDVSVDGLVWPTVPLLHVPKNISLLGRMCIVFQSTKPFGLLLQKYDLQITFANTLTIYFVFNNISVNTSTGNSAAYLHH